MTCDAWLVPCNFCQQISTDIPYTHTRNGQKPAWIKHLRTLKAHHHCVSVTSYKTLAKWTNDKCKKCHASRARERSTSGLGTVAPITVLDNITEMWHAHKVSSDLMSEASLQQVWVLVVSGLGSSFLKPFFRLLLFVKQRRATIQV